MSKGQKESELHNLAPQDTEVILSPERDYRGLKIVQARSLTLFAFLVSEDGLRQAIQKYVGADCYERNADVIDDHIQRLNQVYDQWDSENKDNLFYSLFDIEKLYLTALSSDTFHSPRQLAQELFAEGRLNDVIGFVADDYKLFQMNVATYLLQQLCRINFSNPELRISIYASERFVRDGGFRELSRQRLDQGRLTRGLVPYSEEDKQILIRLWMESVPIKEIAETLGRTTKSVQYHTANFGLPLRKDFRKWTDEEETDVLRLKTERGMTNAQIGEILGRSEKAIHHRLIKIDVVSFRRKPWDQAEFERFQELLATHYSFGEVLEKLSEEFPKGRTVHDLIAKARFERIKIKTKFEIKRTEMEQLLTEGLTEREMATRLGITKKTVWKWKRRLKN